MNISLKETKCRLRLCDYNKSSCIKCKIRCHFVKVEHITYGGCVWQINNYFEYKILIYIVTFPI